MKLLRSAESKILVHIISSEIDFEEYIQVIKDLTASSVVTQSPADAFQIKAAVCEKIDSTKLYLVIPDDIREKLLVELPEINKKINKVELEIEKIKGRISSEQYQSRTAGAKEMDGSKVRI